MTLVELHSWWNFASRGSFIVVVVVGGMYVVVLLLLLCR